MENSPDGQGNEPSGEQNGSQRAGVLPQNNEGREGRLNILKGFFDPVVFIAISILIAIFVLIGSAIFGVDKGVLVSMGRSEYARGLITYLFAVVTIGTAVVLVVSALTGTESDAHKERFQRGKEILSLLLGIFGTIVGFYFGSEVSGGQSRKVSLQVAPLHLSAQVGSPAGSISVNSFVAGGTPPYRVSVGFDDGKTEPPEKLETDGWYTKAVSLPEVSDEKAVTIRLVAIDSEGTRGESSAPVVVKPK